MWALLLTPHRLEQLDNSWKVKSFKKKQVVICIYSFFTFSQYQNCSQKITAISNERLAKYVLNKNFQILMMQKLQWPLLPAMKYLAKLNHHNFSSNHSSFWQDTDLNVKFIPHISVARGVHSPLIEMAPMIKIWQKSLVSSVSVSFSIFEYKSTRVQQ